MTKAAFVTKNKKTSEHYFLDCFTYCADRQNLFNLVEYLIPKFSKLDRKQKMEIRILQQI